MPPEFAYYMIKGHGCIQQLPHSHDIWSLGLLLLEIVCGHPLDI